MTSESESSLLVLSIGPSESQPYKVSVDVKTPYGDKTIASLAAGASASQTFSTRAGSITEGSAIVGLVGDTTTVEVEESYGAMSCA